MAIIHNEITIHAPLEKIWQVLTTPEALDRYDPTVKKSSLISTKKSDLGAKRRVEMADGKNWFEEEITIFKPNEALTYELTACSFPVHRLRHTYSFQRSGDSTKVSQVMEYTVRFGWVGKLLDAIMIQKQSDLGIKKFFGGLKSYVEKG
jgi:ligand-binding SRPBCC domain-containing protein